MKKQELQLLYLDHFNDYYLSVHLSVVFKDLTYLKKSEKAIR